MFRSKKRYDHTKSLQTQFIIFFEAKFFNVNGVHYSDLAIRIYESQSKSFIATMIIVDTGVVLIIMTVVAIKTVLAIMIFVTIVTIVIVQTVMTIVTDMAFS